MNKEKNKKKKNNVILNIDFYFSGKQNKKINDYKDDFHVKIG